MTKDECKNLTNVINDLLTWQGMVTDHLHTPESERNRTAFATCVANRDEQLRKLRVMGIVIPA